MFKDKWECFFEFIKVNFFIVEDFFGYRFWSSRSKMNFERYKVMIRVYNILIRIYFRYKIWNSSKY